MAETDSAPGAINGDDRVPDDGAAGGPAVHDSNQQDFECQDMMVHGADNHPFAPAQDDGVIVPVSVPQDAGPERPEMTDHERAAAVRQILDEDADSGLDLRTLVFEVGPFNRLAQQLQAMSAELVPREIADAVLSHVRNSIHEVALGNDDLAKGENREDGLLARIAALEDLDGRLRNPEHPARALLAKLQEIDVPGVDKLEAGIAHLIRLEGARLDRLTRRLEPPNALSAIFQRLRDTLPAPAGPLVGDARSHRNGELVKALTGLKEVAKELNANAGNAEWERTQGAQSTKEAGVLRERIDALTKGVEDQVDGRDLCKELDSVNEMLDAAKAASVDEEHKSRLEQIAKSVTEFVKRLTAALGRMFANSSRAGSSPRPT